MADEQSDLQRQLDRLIASWENEVVEFKIGNKNTSSDEIGRYVSALSNEANLRGLKSAWLVFGVHNKTHSSPGSDYPCDSTSLNRSGGLKAQIVDGTNLGIAFVGAQYQALLIDFIRKFPGMSRDKINEFMFDEIRGDLDDQQKRTKITNLLTVLRKKGKIENRGSDTQSKWFLIDSAVDSADNQ